MSELSAWDYVVFALMLVGSSLIGLYHGWKGSRVKEDTTDYLLAGRNMGWLPLFVSIVGSFLSAISLLGIPSEIYTYGGQFFLTIASFWVVMPLCIFIFAPLYRNIGITSANEYLELRFSRPVRIFGGVLFILQTVMYLSVVMYAPSLALEAVAGLRLEISLVVTVIICNIYTTIGGMKGVIWTDVFQTCIILIGLIVVLIIGTTQVGSFGDVIKIASDGGRTDIFRFDADPSIRNTFWGFIFGYTFTLMPFFCCGQICVQRYLSAKSNETITK
ncbi:sodium-dependent multivitamin transporter-like [Clytia hemisphaerica]